MEVVLITCTKHVKRDNFYHTFLFVSEHVDETPEELTQRILNAVIEHDGGDYLDPYKYRKMLRYQDELWHKHGLHRIDNGDTNKIIEIGNYTIKKMVQINGLY